jgi:hypothetical protein
LLNRYFVPRFIFYYTSINRGDSHGTFTGNQIICDDMRKAVTHIIEVLSSPGPKFPQDVFQPQPLVVRDSINAHPPGHIIDHQGREFLNAGGLFGVSGKESWTQCLSAHTDFGSGTTEGQFTERVVQAVHNNREYSQHASRRMHEENSTKAAVHITS